MIHEVRGTRIFVTRCRIWKRYLGTTHVGIFSTTAAMHLRIHRRNSKMNCEKGLKDSQAPRPKFSCVSIYNKSNSTQFSAVTTALAPGAVVQLGPRLSPVGHIQSFTTYLTLFLTRTIYRYILICVRFYPSSQRLQVRINSWTILSSCRTAIYIHTLILGTALRAEASGKVGCDGKLQASLAR